MIENKLSLENQIKHSSLKNAWEHIGIHHHHGINIPLFSLHSKNSCGIGEFLDLKLLIDFCKKIDMDIIQLLPLNDSGYEASPYNAVSSQALNPIYISLWDLPFVSSDEDLSLDLTAFKKFTYLQKIAYNAVLSSKIAFLKKYFKKHFIHFEQSAPYQTFLEENTWLTDYGLFKSLKEQYAHKGWFSWSKKHQNLSPSLRKELLKEKEEEIRFYIFLQFLSFTQMEDVKYYATKNKVFLKGDIPILISPESLDVWRERENFDLSFSAGSLPDQFTPDGQNWGFPIYNWEYIEESGYNFWKNRLKTASKFYHLYRIDHIIGLYRIFAIPRDKDASFGEYIPKDPGLAIIQGEQILAKLNALTDKSPIMLPIGEDLGVEIDHIKRSMDKLSIPGTKIPRWERYVPDFKEYIPYEKYPPISLTSVSTHDSETLHLWWKNNPEEVKFFAKSYGMKYEEELTFDLRYQILKDSHNTPSLFHINLLPEYLALFDSLVWENPDDERINLPGTVLPSNWCYKMRPSLETLLSHKDIQSTIKSMITPQ